MTITGSGSEDRDEAVRRASGYRPFREIADTLGRRGIAVLRLDDRGVGGSDIGPPTATTADFADDIRAGVAYLRARPEIDTMRIGLVGHSEGGDIAPMVAATDPQASRDRAHGGAGVDRAGDPALAAARTSSIAIAKLTRAQRDSALARRAQHRFRSRSDAVDEVVSRVRSVGRGAAREARRC